MILQSRFPRRYRPVKEPVTNNKQSPKPIPTMGFAPNVRTQEYLVMAINLGILAKMSVGKSFIESL